MKIINWNYIIDSGQEGSNESGNWASSAESELKRVIQTYKAQALRDKLEIERLKHQSEIWKKHYLDVRRSVIDPIRFPLTSALRSDSPAVACPDVTSAGGSARVLAADREERLSSKLTPLDLAKLRLTDIINAPQTLAESSISQAKWKSFARKYDLDRISSREAKDAKAVSKITGEGNSETQHKASTWRSQLEAITASLNSVIKPRDRGTDSSPRSAFAYKSSLL